MSTTGWYSTLRHRLESSSIRRTYWAMAKRKTLASRRQEEGFYRELLVGLKRDDLIFDIGANVGAKTDLFLRLGARIVAVEPDDGCQRILRDRFLRYRLRPCPVTLIDKAASDKIGTVEMLIDGPGSAVNTISRKWADHLKEGKQDFKYAHCGLQFSRSRSVGTTTIDRLVSEHGLPFFIKVDVEGHELSVLLGMQRPVPFLSFEVNLSAFRNEGIECARVLSKLAPDGLFNYTPDCNSGLALGKWIGSQQFCKVLDSCADETIEVFWRSGCGLARV
jgi:FkbM family methyltransferase